MLWRDVQDRGMSTGLRAQLPAATMTQTSSSSGDRSTVEAHEWLSCLYLLLISLDGVVSCATLGSKQRLGADTTVNCCQGKTCLLQTDSKETTNQTNKEIKSTCSLLRTPLAVACAGARAGRCPAGAPGGCSPGGRLLQPAAGPPGAATASRSAAGTP